mmetsp:Transcript_60074/g.95398  ORF Transcript_60074/g.95398 Transcript_60074/m.95398 type:complete len:278 (+) Transcript_60074:225-1058(+)
MSETSAIMASDASIRRRLKGIIGVELVTIITITITTMIIAVIVVGSSDHGIPSQRLQNGRDLLLRLDEESEQIIQGNLWHIHIDEGGGNASFPAAARSSDAMDVVLNLLGHIEVDHVANIWEIESFGRDIGGDQHVDIVMALGIALILKRLDGVLALCHVFASVDGDSSHSLQQQVLVHVVDIALIAAKDENRRRRLLEALEQIHDLGLVLHVLHFLDHVEIGGACPSHIDDNRLHHRLARQIAHFLRHGRAEKHLLNLVLAKREDVADVVLKANVH